MAENHNFLNSNNEKILKSIINKIKNLILKNYIPDYQMSPFFDVSLDLLCIADLGGKILKVNKAFENTLKFNEKDFVNSNFLNFVHEEDKIKTLEGIEILKKEGQILNFVNRCITKDGNYKYIEWKSRIYNDFIYSAGSDISKRIAALEKLKQSENTYRQIFENSPLGILHYNNDGIITKINDNFAQIIGSSKEVLTGLDMFSLKDERIKKAVKDSLDKNLISRLEIVYKAQTSGKVFPVRIVFAPVFTNQRELLGGVGIIEDISSRIEAEKKIKENLEKYLCLFEHAADGILIGNRNGIIIDANSSICKMSGYSREEIIGKNISFLFPKEVIEKSPLDYNSVLSGKTVLAQRDLQKKDGSFIFIEMNTSQVNENTLQTYIRDVTEQYLLKERLRHSEKMEAIGQLTGGIAHDYNNMLSGIFGGIELLEKTSNPKEASKYIEIIKKSAKRTAELNEKLLSFARKTELVFLPVNINEAIENTIDILKYTLDKKISIIFEKNKKDIFVNGNLSQLQNVFMNLGINSGFAMKNGGRLCFETSVMYLDSNYLKMVGNNLNEGNYVLVSVSDEGEGIPVKYQSKVFEPFFTTKNEKQGSGLGLASAYGIISEHNGLINFYSEENRGTVFHIYLPLIESLEFFDENKIEQISNLNGSGTILIVDDEEIVRTTVSAMLSEIGYNVLEAENGKAGYEIYKEKHELIDVVILDMIMPEMNGKECFYAIRLFNPFAKIVLCSGFSEEEDFIELKEGKVNDFIRKPFYISELAGILSRLIKND